MGIPVEYRPLPDARSKTPIPGKPFRLVRVPTNSVRIDRVKPYMRVYYWPPLPATNEPTATKAGSDSQSEVSPKEIHYGVILDPIYFPFNESEVVPPATYLDRIVDWLKADSAHGLTLTGHADPRGSAARNQRLSEERAEAVKAILVRLGAPEGQIETVGVGAAKPAKNGKTREAKFWGSRRVEFDLHPVQEGKTTVRPKAGTSNAE
jgi:outer membrane protein OmpA-like peptidoglycan-associated protein